MKRVIAIVVVVLVVCLIGRGLTKRSGKKLQVFILAGQSNMVGHAKYITIPDLINVDDPSAKALAKLLFKEGAITPGMARDQIESGFKRNDLAKKLDQGKIVGEKEIAAAEAELKKLQAEYDAKSEKIKDAFSLSKRVYISSIADGNCRSGPLTMGYGGDEDAIGPELGFGFGLEQELDAPILLIKTSWGGKTLHYDFRPPSAGPYPFNEGQKKLETEAYKSAWVKDNEEYRKVWSPKSKKAIAAFWVEHDKFMVANLSKERYAEWQQVAAEWHNSCVSAANGGPDTLTPWKVWGLERKAQTYFKGTETKAPEMDYQKTLWKERPALAKAPTAESLRQKSGYFYREMNTAVHNVLKDLKKYHPEYNEKDGYEIAGFVWFQGFNDQFAESCYSNYRDNMIAFIKDIRKEYEVADLPFVIGVLGTAGTKQKVDEHPVSIAQRQAAAAPEFNGNVVSVESVQFAEIKALEMWGNRSWNKPETRVEFSLIASEKPYHYMGSGKLFTRFGDAMAGAMGELIEKKK